MTLWDMLNKTLYYQEVWIREGIFCSKSDF